ncbi:hypothetical protein C8R44DRAFT_869515 [Mycena epipterygia]|nr:hypothetical protein C8R44DRAFT_869515 [Mycena epipterygia]
MRLEAREAEHRFRLAGEWRGGCRGELRSCRVGVVVAVEEAGAVEEVRTVNELVSALDEDEDAAADERATVDEAELERTPEDEDEVIEVDELILRGPLELDFVHNSSLELIFTINNPVHSHPVSSSARTSSPAASLSNVAVAFGAGLGRR